MLCLKVFRNFSTSCGKTSDHGRERYYSGNSRTGVCRSFRRLSAIITYGIATFRFRKVWNGDEIEETQTVLDQHNLEPLKLGPKEGLALINGTQFMVAHGVAGLDKMKYLLDLAILQQQ